MKIISFFAKINFFFQKINFLIEKKNRTKFPFFFSKKIVCLMKNIVKKKMIRWKINKMKEKKMYDLN